MTLNQVIRRIKLIAESHKQVRTFGLGLVGDFTTDQKTKYPAIFLQDTSGKISTSGHATTLGYRMFFLDLANVSEGTKLNELDVQSDMLSVAMDIIAQMNRSEYDDWALSTDNNLQLIVEGDDTESNGDMVAGCYVDLSLRVIFTQNVCEIPTTLTDYTPTDPDDMKLVYDIKYVATGTEGSTLTIPELKGKKILLVTRENAPIYKVSNAPDSAEFTWDNTDIVLGKPANAGERFLILYRNY